MAGMSYEAWAERNQREAEAMRRQNTQQRDTIAHQQDVMAHAGEVVADIGSNDDVIRCEGLYPAWTPDNYRPGMVRLYEDYPYKVYQPHDSRPNPTWTPEAYPAGWIPLHGTTRETALPYRQPTAAHDMYLVGEMMVWVDGAVMRALRDTVYSPDAHAPDWEVAA